MPLPTVRTTKNKLEKEIEEHGNLKFVFPNAYYVWFLAAPGQVEQRGRIHAQVLHDMNRLGDLARRNQKTLVAICTDNVAADVACSFADKIQGWRALRIDKTGTTDEKAIQVDNVTAIAARSCDMVITYGQPTDDMYSMLDDIDPDDPPQLEIRRFEEAPTPSPRIAVDNGNDPYSAYWQKVERLRRWYKTRWDGKPPLREFIRPYPTYNIDGESGVGGMD